MNITLHSKKIHNHRLLVEEVRLLSRETISCNREEACHDFDGYYYSPFYEEPIQLTKNNDESVYRDDLEIYRFESRFYLQMNDTASKEDIMVSFSEERYSLQRIDFEILFNKEENRLYLGNIDFPYREIVFGELVFNDATGEIGSIYERIIQALLSLTEFAQIKVEPSLFH